MTVIIVITVIGLLIYFATRKKSTRTSANSKHVSSDLTPNSDKGTQKSESSNASEKLANISTSTVSDNKTVMTIELNEES
jgi:hypothetical protein